MCSGCGGGEGKSTDMTEGRGVCFKGGKGGGEASKQHTCWFFFMLERCSSHESCPDSTRFLLVKRALLGWSEGWRGDGKSKGCVVVGLWG